MSAEAGEAIGLLRKVLASANAQATMLGVSRPSRQYVTFGGTVYDCEQLTVSGNVLGTGAVGSPDVGAPFVNCDVGLNLSVEIALVRCAEAVFNDDGNPPSVAQIEADAASHSQDSALLVNAVEALGGPGLLGAIPISVTYHAPEGGFIATVLNTTLNLWDV